MKGQLLNAAVIFNLVIFPHVISSFKNDSIDGRRFTIDYKNNRFLKDGKRFQYVSGSIHYFRSMEEQWDDLLRKCRLGGLNAITT